ncbi:UvrD-helicase domain-containing protein [Undibacterium sp.]|jgi:ATP-dependent helicase/nuclease subunit A|uniref:UvrD-helicase domain-containing protein n=1 Tax=Undibacterium sp. TaxID=1914977 RepID=UPI002C7D9A49|nr:UvrD-helicase domain-containing protein [Undibacterium sp.]HTD05413.1 UvrD-helicase domain-containing protein [Undibacterium sp.]
MAENTVAQAYEIDGRPADPASFTAAACDPQRSVVVEACAGSGKTWLLVARMLRLLLAGAEPAELLAITFTRKAAQEMRERLVQLLQELALADQQGAALLLLERGIQQHELAHVLPLARRLYDKVLSSPQSLAMDTFHSWFGRLIQLAPLASGVPHGFSLVEATGELQREAYGQLMQSLKDADNAPVKEALLFLYREVGDFNAHKMMNAFLDKRAEWWASNEDESDGKPLDWLRELCGLDAERDSRLGLWDDAALRSRLDMLARILGQGSAANQGNAVKIESALTAGASLENFEALCGGFFTGTGGLRSHNTKTKALSASIEKHLGPDSASAFEDECAALGEALRLLERRSAEKFVLGINQALFTVGAAYLDCYQALKSDQRVFDFADLEWQAYRLLSNEEYAAYLHSRLDARYKHILLDEFQDTNPLQWSIVQAWLDAYGDDAARPSVFVVGDPKQSIYRFRRAEPRVFSAARMMLARQGAYVLRTNQTRRNAQAVVEVLNRSMQENPIYAPQTTASALAGEVWRLPLITEAVTEGEEQDNAARFPLRNPLATPLEEAEDARRLDEGRQVAKTLWRARHAMPGAPVPWSEMMLLVRRRTHLSAYERALREAGIPFVSSRRGGLLEALEVADLIALLTFLITPGDNRALAHVLKSPVIGAADDDLIALAQRTESNWWKRLQASVEEGGNPVLLRAVGLLRGWMRAAHDLPVHDLLDRVLHQGNLLARYAQHAAPADRSQVIGNISAFTELALNMDAGRYPSLPKFIAALGAFQQGGEADAPDESTVDSAADAVRILTIHSAKGLEASVVVMLDANNSDAAKDQVGILCQWPLEPGERKHFSVFGRKDQRGAARDGLFGLEEAQAAQENWNLLYVAATRAKQLLIVSGIAGKKSADGGMAAGSWYQRLGMVPELILAESAAVGDEMALGDFALPIFDPPQLALPPTEIAAAPTEEQLEGIALHALMERLTQQDWPVRLPEAEVIANWLPCATTMAVTIRRQAHGILSQPGLERYFNPAHFIHARNEMDVLFEQQVLRLDRVVVFDDEVWVLDYKRRLLDMERAGYQQQLASYGKALQEVFGGKRIRGALIVGDGQLVEML